LHEIGYAPGLGAAGFPPLDGARYLRDVIAAPPDLCLLVAHCSSATIEAGGRGLLKPLLDEFPVVDRTMVNLIDALTFCDLSVGPTGRGSPPAQTIEQLLSRHPPDDPAHASIQLARPILLAVCRRVAAARETGWW
jgi:hypothetical protein